MANYDPTSDIIAGTEGDTDALISSLKDDLPTKYEYYSIDNTSTPISTSSGTPVTVPSASHTVTLDAAQDENIEIIGEMQFSGSAGNETIALDIYDGSTALRTVRGQAQAASTNGYKQQLYIRHVIKGGVSGSQTYSMRWYIGGTTVYSAGHSFSVKVTKRRA